MAFVKKGMRMRRYKKPVSRKAFAKRAVSKAKTSRLVKLIKKVSLRQCETKHTHVINENLQLYHNVPYIFGDILYTEQGINDTGGGLTSQSNRIGDQIVARGLSFKFWFANKADRPNVTYKIVFFKYQSSILPVSAPAPYYPQGTSNYLIRDLDTEKYKILKVINFKIQTSAQRITAQDVFNSAEAHKALNVWIPLKNQKVQYEDGSSQPKFMDVGFTIIAYDSYGTLTTDNIASYAVNRKLYFKDP